MELLNYNNSTVLEPTVTEPQLEVQKQSTLFRLWVFAHPYRWYLALGFVLMFAATIASLIPAYLIMPLTDKILVPMQNGEQIPFANTVPYLLGLLGSSLLTWMLSWARTYVMAWVSESVCTDLRTQTYDHLINLSLEYFGGKRTGDLIARIGSETNRINIFLSVDVLGFMQDMLVIIMISFTLFLINPKLALVPLIPLPIIAFMIFSVRTKLFRGFERCDRVWSQIVSVLSDTIPGVRVVKCFGQEAQEVKRFQAANKSNLHVNNSMNKVWSFFSPTTTLLTDIGVLIVWGIGIYLLATQNISLGVLTTFIAYVTRFYARLDSMSRIVSATQRAAVTSKRIFEILDRVNTIADPKNPVEIKAIEGELCLQNVNFYYKKQKALNHVHLHIKPGEKIGLVGHSGAGKSTLINLICRFYDPIEGTITLDGVDIRHFKLSEYRRHFGVVLQDPFLFYGTIAENIAYGNPNASRAQIVAAARAAYAHEFIAKKPLGYDSVISEGGHSLSGGERQRISIARALLIDPKILILDEATSSVDSHSEHEIQSALQELIKGRTTIAISHRLSTLNTYDRLVVMKHGEIIEIGNHAELIQQQGYYYELYQHQVSKQSDSFL